MNKKKITEELHRRLDTNFKDFMSAEKRYFEQPSIPNGSRRQESKHRLDIALREAEQYMLEKYGIGKDDFHKMVEEFMS